MKVDSQISQILRISMKGVENKGAIMWSGLGEREGRKEQDLFQKKGEAYLGGRGRGM